MSDYTKEDVDQAILVLELQADCCIVDNNFNVIAEMDPAPLPAGLAGFAMWAVLDQPCEDGMDYTVAGCFYAYWCLEAAATLRDGWRPKEGPR